MEFESRMTSENTRKMLEIIEEKLARLKIVREIGWCSSYTIGKRIERKYLFELSWFNISPNRRIYEKNKVEFIPFSLCNCFNCRCLIE